MFYRDDPHMHEMAPMDAGITFLATNFTRKMQETSDFKYFVSFSCYETYIKVFTRIGPNSQKLKILFQFNFGQWDHLFRQILQYHVDSILLR